MKIPSATISIVPNDLAPIVNSDAFGEISIGKIENGSCASPVTKKAMDATVVAEEGMLKKFKVLVSSV